MDAIGLYMHYSNEAGHRQNALISLTKYHAWPDGEIEMTQSRWVEMQTGRRTDA